MSNSARGRIAESVKNAYAAGYNDCKNGNIHRIDMVAYAETGRIVGMLLTFTDAHMYSGTMSGVNEDRLVAETKYEAAFDTIKSLRSELTAAFGADDDGEEQ